jgi:hypothetical protein
MMEYSGATVTLTARGTTKEYNWESGKLYEIAKFKVKAPTDSSILVKGFTLSNVSTTNNVDIRKYLDNAEVTVDGDKVSASYEVNKDDQLVISFKKDVEVAAKANVEVVVKASLSEDFDDYGKTVHTISDLCKYVGCDVPEVYEEKYYESRFKDGIKKLKEKKTAFDMPASRDDEYSFLRGFNRGLFNSGENSGISDFLLCSLGENNEHMDIKFMKDVIEVALLYDAMRMLQMTWGNTNYYRQDVDYGPHIEFMRKCLDVAEEKKREYENDENDED